MSLSVMEDRPNIAAIHILAQSSGSTLAKQGHTVYDWSRIGLGKKIRGLDIKLEKLVTKN